MRNSAVSHNVAARASLHGGRGAERGGRGMVLRPEEPHIEAGQRDEG